MVAQSYWQITSRGGWIHIPSPHQGRRPGVLPLGKYRAFPSLGQIWGLAWALSESLHEGLGEGWCDL